MRSSQVFFMTAAWACLLFTGGNETGNAGDKKITKKQLPTAVVKAFRASYPHAKIKGQSIESEKGKTFYEIESTDGKISRDLLFTAEGKVVEVEETMDARTLSDEMKNTLSKQYPKGKIVKAERVTRGDSVTYEIHVKVGKKTTGIELDSSGKILKGGNEESEKEDNEDDEDD